MDRHIYAAHMARTRPANDGKRGKTMRRLLLLIFLVPCTAEAEDIHIYVDWVVRQERISPQPQIVRPRVSLHVVLRENGTVDDEIITRGKYPEEHRSSTRLGKERFRVVNERTISRTTPLGDQRRTLTVTTQGSGCTAKLDITGPPEFRAHSTDLNQMAVYRNAQVESITCRIQ